MSATRDRIAAIRAEVLRVIERGQQPFAHACVNCVETQTVLMLDDTRDEYMAQLQREDCPRHRVQRIRRVLVAIDERFDLLMRPAARGVH
jgi:hypothetical protein